MRARSKDVCINHKEDRVQAFYFSRPNWPPPTRRRVSPRLLLKGWRYTFACGRGDGGSQFGQGDRHCGMICIYVLCGLNVYICFFSSSGKNLSISRRSQQLRRSYLDRKVISRVQRQCALFRSSGSENIINFADSECLINIEQADSECLNNIEQADSECLNNIEQADRECA
jgi:hypothetical protein